MAEPGGTDASQTTSAETQQIEIDSIMAQVNEAQQQREQNALYAGSVFLALAAACAWFVAGRFLRNGSSAWKVVIISGAVPFILFAMLVVGIGLGTGREITSLFVSRAGDVNVRALGLFSLVLFTGLLFASLRLALFKRKGAKAAKRIAEKFE